MCALMAWGRICLIFSTRQATGSTANMEEGSIGSSPMGSATSSALRSASLGSLRKSTYPRTVRALALLLRFCFSWNFSPTITPQSHLGPSKNSILKMAIRMHTSLHLKTQVTTKNSNDNQICIEMAWIPDPQEILFTVYDTPCEDGICCEYGAGSFSLSMGGKKCWTGSSFSYSETVTHTHSMSSGSESAPTVSHPLTINY
mmetsp:Transcript_45772/g.139059  ORF Transcript_45772/g.139059 Transcript_45772/m.139059 type:complete len:201 (-) Transcript_45772:66-668(-)